MGGSVTEEARKKANLRLLQRTCDASITDILASATHVVLYSFANAAWSKSDVDGSLFVVATVSKGKTGYSLIILNRSSSDNFSMPIVAHLHMQHQDPYMIVKRASDADPQKPIIQGVWFEHPQERIALVQTMEQLIESLQFVAQAEQEQLRNQTPLKGAATRPPPAPTPPPAASAAAYTATAQSTPIGQLLAAAHQPQQPLPPKQQPNTQAANIATPPAPQPSPAPDNAVTPDERAHLANLLSQTAIASVSPTTATKGGSETVPLTPNMETPAAAAAASQSSAGSSAVATTSTTKSSTDNATAATSSATLPGEGVALDKRSLQLALLSLIQDDRFLDLLHSQYLRVIKARNTSNNKQGDGET